MEEELSSGIRGELTDRVELSLFRNIPLHQLVSEHSFESAGFVIMPPRRRPLQDAMEDDRISRLQQMVENLADSVAAMQLQVQQQQQQQQQQQAQQQQQQRQRPDPRVVDEEVDEDVDAEGGSEEDENPFAPL